jgi:hypothetical protein
MPYGLTRFAEGREHTIFLGGSYSALDHITLVPTRNPGPTDVALWGRGYMHVFQWVRCGRDKRGRLRVGKSFFHACSKWSEQPCVRLLARFT